MKNPIPARWAIGLLLAVPAVAGCGGNKPVTPLPPGFVPAGYSRQYMPGVVHNPIASIMGQGDPNVPASVKAHVIPGLPPSAQYPPRP